MGEGCKKLQQQELVSEPSAQQRWAMCCGGFGGRFPQQLHWSSFPLLRLAHKLVWLCA